MAQPQAPGNRQEQPPSRAQQPPLPGRLTAWLLACLWTALVFASLGWNFLQLRATMDEQALTQARTAFEKDVILRRWSASLGGVYAPITPQTPPNAYLDVPERDITTPGGRALTMLNPAYMTRLLHEQGRRDMGLHGHITSLNPLRPENAPDPWEAQALLALAEGASEASLRADLDGRPHLRLMRPLFFEKACQACHAKQGYELGQVVGGISVAVPLEPLLAAHGSHERIMTMTHGLLWALGLLGLGLAYKGLRRRQQARDQAEAAREKTLAELRQALEQVRTLSGLLPICAHCKRIRDEGGQWQGMERYISQRSEASFSHGICPQCARQLYPELMGPEDTEGQA